MKNIIAIPLENGILCQHFGHCTEFALVEVHEKQVVNKSIVIPPPHEPGLLPAWLGKQGVTYVIAGGMGKHAKDLFNQNNISVHTGAESKNAEELVYDWIEGNLTSSGNSCDH
ncbi:MAG: ATPase [Bacteroidetes bacterium HGW-Bacteroidetes-7]|jgi:predicted Fe-Mo cluster-binding NifX family protein|nr:MAG: ATPase [Bacteroidetes bacterium HGW-Bacteroidetes-7]